MESPIVKTAAGFALLTIIVYILYIGRALILPLVIALVFWYIIIRLTALFQKITIGRWRFPYSIALFLSIIITGAVIYAFFLLMTHSISSIIDQAPKYQRKLQYFLTIINGWFGGKLNVSTLFSEINLNKLFSNLAVLLSNLASNSTLILIYLLFLLLEHKSFAPKLKAFCKTEKKYKRIQETINNIDRDINLYLRMKTIVNAIAGLATYITLLTFGIDYAEFWGMLIFLLHYIPFIGPIIAVILILIAMSIQITTLPLYITVGIILVAIQFIVGNLIEPKWMGSKLNLSPIFILLALAFWGSIWGILGMFLCVPIMVIMVIIFEKLPATKPIAALLAEKHY